MEASSPKKQSPLAKFGHNLSASVEIDGVRGFQHARSVLGKLSWGLLLLASCGALVYGINRTVAEFRDSGIVSTQSIELPRSLEFPKVYICPKSFVNNTYVEAVGGSTKDKLSHMLKEYLNLFVNISDNSFLSNVDTSYNYALDKDLDALEKINQSIDYINETDEYANEPVEEYFLRIGYSKSAFITEMKFGDSLVLDVENNVTEYFDANHGKCFLVDIEEPQHKPDQGLTLLIDIQVEEQLKDLRHLPLQDGIILHMLEDLPKINTIKGGPLLAPGFRTKLSMTFQKIKRINDTRSKDQQLCSDKSRKLQLLYGPYSWDTCIEDCFQLVIWSKCQCIAPADSRLLTTAFKHATFCNSSTFSNCEDEVFETQGKDECRKKCYPRCEDVVYSVSLNLLRLYSAQNSTDVERHEGLLVVDIAFSSIQIIVHSQNPAADFLTLVANFGGQLDLWIGASVLTIIQLIFHTVKFLLSLRNRNRL